MKKILTFLGIVTLGFVLASPALAGGHGHYRGHCGRVVHGGYHTAYYAPAYYAPYGPPRSHVSFFFGLGVPVVAAPAYVYAPPPLVVEPVAYVPVWIPGQYRYQGGTRVFISGHWSR